MASGVYFGGTSNSFISSPCRTDPSTGSGVVLPTESGTGCLSFWFNLPAFINSPGLGGGYAFNNFNILTIARGPMNAGTGVDQYGSKQFSQTFGGITPNPIWAPVNNTMTYLQVIFSRPGYNGFTAGSNYLNMAFYSCQDQQPYYTLPINTYPFPFVEKAWNEQIPCDDKWHHIMIVWDTTTTDTSPHIRAALDGVMLGDALFRNGYPTGTFLPGSGWGDGFDCGWSNPTRAFTWTASQLAPYTPFKMKFSTNNFSTQPFAAYIGQVALGLSEVYLNVWPTDINGTPVTYTSLAINNQNVMQAATDYFIDDGHPARLNQPHGSMPFNVKTSDIKNPKSSIYTSGIGPCVIFPPQIYCSGDSTSFASGAADVVPSFDNISAGDGTQFNYKFSTSGSPGILYDWTDYTNPNAPFPASSDVNPNGSNNVSGVVVGSAGVTSNGVAATPNSRVNSYTGWGTSNATITLSDASVRTFNNIPYPDWFPETILDISGASTTLYLTDGGACAVGKKKLFDFSANTAKDMLVQTTAGQTIMWQFASGSWTYTTQNIGSTITSNMRIIAVGDFNGDGRGDIMWRNTVTGEVTVWYLTNSTGGFTVTSFGSTLDLTATVTGVGDFNGDGRTDVFWHVPYSGANFVWQMGSTVGTFTTVSKATMASNFSMKGLGDFNADGSPDQLWFDLNSGKASIVTSSATTVIPAPIGMSPWGSVVGAPAPEGMWFVEGIGDFDGNGRSDILWRCTSGDFVISYFTGTSMAYTNSQFRMFNNNYQVVGIGDITGDGKDDIAFRNTLTGEVVVASGFSGSTYSTHSLGTISLDTHF